MSVIILPREKTTPLFNLCILIASLIAGLAAVGIVFLLKGINPFFAIGEIFRASFGSSFGIKETLTKSVPLILIGSGLALAYRAKFWNIGAESQLLVGAIFGTWIGLHWGPQLPGYIILPLMFIGGFIGG
jgi:simple sugar transport system permease protein